MVITSKKSWKTRWPTSISPTRIVRIQLRKVIKFRYAAAWKVSKKHVHRFGLVHFTQTHTISIPIFLAISPFSLIWQYSTPLIISFELPIMMHGQAVPDNDTKYVKDIESKYNVQVRPPTHWLRPVYYHLSNATCGFLNLFRSQVIFSSRSKLHSSLVLVKGSEREAVKVQQATRLLINFMCQSMSVSIVFFFHFHHRPQYFVLLSIRSLFHTECQSTHFHELIRSLRFV